MYCEARDAKVVVVGYSRGRIPWPIGRRVDGTGQALVVYGGLAAALRRESNAAVCHWFGVRPYIVSRWRKALGVGRATKGTSRLMGRPKSAETRARMSAAHKRVAQTRNPNGRPWTAAENEVVRTRPPAEAARATRRTLRSVYCRRVRLGLPRVGGWTPAEDEWVRTLPAPEVVRRTGRTPGSVYNRRMQLGVTNGRVS